MAGLEIAITLSLSLFSLLSNKGIFIEETKSRRTQLGTDLVGP